jgi:ribose transport system permease protein
MTRFPTDWLWCFMDSSIPTDGPASLHAVTADAVPEPLLKERRVRFYLTNEFGLLVLIVLFGIAFTLVTPRFLSHFNLFILGRTAAVNIMVGFSMMVVIVTGGLDLSVGSIGVCAAMAGGWLMQVVGVPWPLAIAGGLVLGAALGFVNGWVVVKSGLHSFIITLASMSIFFGVMVFLTRGEAYREISPSFASLGHLKLFGWVSPLLIVAIVIGLALMALYRLTALGREMLAAGARPAAAELSGIRVKRIFILCHMLAGLLAGVAGLMLVARNGAAIPSMAGQLGQDWLLPAFLGPVLGGTLLAGGFVSPLGTLLGGFLLTMLTNGLLLLRVGEFWVQSVLGLLLLAAVLMDQARRAFIAKRKMV